MRYLLFVSIMFSTLATVAQENLILNGIHKDSVCFYIGFQKVNEQFNYLQAAQKFSTEKAGSILQQVELGRLIIPANVVESRIVEPTNTTFLLHIYDVDSLTGAPGASLISEPLEVKNRSNPIVKIDLRKYKIRIPGKTFFVSIEWLTNSINQRFMQLSGNIELVPGKRFRKTAFIYQPFVGMVKNKKTTSDAWVMTSERQWKLYTHNMPYMTDIAISAHLVNN
ncbi:hypothetical protein [Pedobacter foliorum]|uniref:hypothetical protein n=1 Tax=Pedobacter foliorum TaxID=2739058 RepID=UPI0015676AAF|nr:hypothetical protein [Pedobacter foliorum]NRF37207.1 hypothetical protein [Pedobacter foliorum]